MEWIDGTRDPSLGTTIMAVEYEGGVVLAADSRTSTGIYVANRVSDKITAVAPPFIYCARSGSAADTQMLADLVRRYTTALALETKRPATVRTAAALFRELIYQNKSRLTAGVICAGWDPSKNWPGVLDHAWRDHGASTVCDRWQRQHVYLRLLRRVLSKGNESR
ncbi:Proteasome subunit beta type-6 [Cyanidiococcus yangmingshanensis]|uniref:Proteasome subunit beta type-6 n=1 Tax=Cyanidiococcus yangmingshanensis TaxID=2690220 RepID=A0A7J7IFK2_9RHOD|nr:Proteasome subunit beta type-6 [Cyanidiococcus yangmingshanensis]